MIGSDAPNDTLLGDASAFFTGLELAIEWLERGDVDGCLVTAAEELDWLSAEALRFYSENFIPSEAAAAVYLESAEGPVRIECLPAPVPYASIPREDAACSLRGRLAPENDGHSVLIDSRNGIRRFDRAEEIAWHDWRGPRWSPKTLLGDCMGAAGGLQTVAAVAALKHGLFRHAVVSCTGANQQAAGVKLAHGSAAPSPVR
jgi:3-oxoacyl-(acyl-carrier-protein) synthase